MLLCADKTSPQILLHTMFYVKVSLWLMQNKNAIKDNFENIETNLSEAIGMSEGVWGGNTGKKVC